MPRLHAGFCIRFRPRFRARGDHLEDHEMSGTMALALALLSFLSMWCCYWAGQQNMYRRMKDLQERRKRWAEWEDYDE